MDFLKDKLADQQPTGTYPREVRWKTNFLCLHEIRGHNPACHWCMVRSAPNQSACVDPTERHTYIYLKDMKSRKRTDQESRSGRLTHAHDSCNQA